VYDEILIGDEMQTSFEVYASEEGGVDEGIPNPFGEQPTGPGGDFSPDDNPPPPPEGGMYQGSDGNYQPHGGMYGGPEGEYHPAGSDEGIPNPFNSAEEAPHGEHENHDGELRNVMKDALDNGATPEEAFSSVMEAANNHAMENGVSQEQIDTANGVAQGAFDEAMANGASAEEAFARVSEAVREAMPENEDGGIPNPFGDLAEPVDKHMGEHMDGDTPPPHPDGHVNEFIAPLFDGLNYEDGGDSTWNLPISADAVNVEENSFVISGEMLGDPSMLPPEATDNGDGTYTINSWPIESFTDNGDGSVTLNVDIGNPTPEGEHPPHGEGEMRPPEGMQEQSHGEGNIPPPPPEGWQEPQDGNMPPPPQNTEGNERGVFDKVMDAAKDFNPFK